MAFSAHTQAHTLKRILDVLNSESQLEPEVWYNILFSYFMEYKAPNPPTPTPKSVRIRSGGNYRDRGKEQARDERKLLHGRGNVRLQFHVLLIERVDPLITNEPFYKKQPELAPVS